MSKVVSNKARAGFVNVFTPNDDEKYGLTLIFDNKKDLANLKQNVDAYIKENGLEGKKLEMPWKSGDEKADKDDAYEDLRGKILVNCKTKFKPAVVDAARIPIDNQDEFYSGCYVKAVISPYKWTYKKREGISFNVDAVQKVAEGERLGGGPINVDDYFEVVEEAVSTDIDI
jgi:hypothetical protein